MAVCFETASGAVWRLERNEDGTYAARREGPWAWVRDGYSDLVIMELEVGVPALLMSKRVGHGAITTSDVVRVWEE